MRIKLIVTLILLHIGLWVYGQQDPIYSQYRFNMGGINPAYAGSWNTTEITLMSRMQWLGFEGAPKTHSLILQSPLTSENVACGLVVVMDQIGQEKRMSFSGDYSYRIVLKSNLFLRLGLRVGITNYTNNLSNYSLDEPDDQDFDHSIRNEFYPNFGLGAFLYSSNFYFGISTPRLRKEDVLVNEENKGLYTEEIHYFVMGGMLVPLGDRFDLKPSLFAPWVQGAPISWDLGTDLFVDKKFGVGVNYKYNTSIGASAQWIVADKLHIGYSYERGVGKWGKYQTDSHEIMVSYQLSFWDTRYSSPRLF